MNAVQAMMRRQKQDEEDRTHFLRNVSARWRELRSVISEGRDNEMGQAVSRVDVLWHSSGFEVTPGVVLLAAPYTNSHSRFIYLETLHVNLEIGCLIFKTHESSGEELTRTKTEFCSEPKGVRFIAQLSCCPVCDRWGPRNSKHDAFEKLGVPLSSYWMRNFVYYQNSQLFPSTFDPENIPSELAEILQMRTYARPVRSNFCGETIACPGYNSKIEWVARRKLPRSSANFFKLTAAASQIQQKFETDKPQTAPLKTP